MTLIDAAATQTPFAEPKRDLIAALDTGSITVRETLPTETLGDGFDPVQARLRDWLRSWHPQRVPAFEPVRDTSPDGQRRSALKTAPTRGDGAVRVTASLYDPPTREGAPLAWSRNWVSVAVLPQAPEAGRVYYRFAVGSRLVLDGQAETSLVSTSLNFGAVADAATASPFDAAGFQTPVARPLVGVQGREDADAEAVQVIEGSLDVAAGDTPALAFVLGLDLLFRDGWLRLHEGSSAWVGPTGAGATGTIETRFVPAALLRVVDEAA